MLVVIAGVVLPTYRVPSDSMSPLLAVGDRIVVNRTSYWRGEPERGDVVVFRAPGGWSPSDFDAGRRNPVLELWGQTTGLGPADQAVVKRVIAVGGDTVQCCNASGLVVVTSPTGRPTAVAEPRGSSATDEEQFGPVKVPPGRLWLMGDNRQHSFDSRNHVTDDFRGTVSDDDVVGRVAFRLTPLRDAGAVNSRLRAER